MSRIEALCISEKKGMKKQAANSITFKANYGIDGDAHAGEGHRQVSLLAAGDIERVRRSANLELRPGSFAENVIVSDLDFLTIGLGTRLRLGRDAVVSITQIGKVCHSRCEIFRQTGDCIMPRFGLFARVEEGGVAESGDTVEIIELVSREDRKSVV